MDEIDRQERALRSGYRELELEIKRLQSTCYRLRDRGVAVDLSEVEERMAEVEQERYALIALALPKAAWIESFDPFVVKYQFYTAGDVEAWCKRATDMGCRQSRFPLSTALDLLYLRKVPNAPLREHMAGRRATSELVKRVYTNLAHLESLDALIQNPPGQEPRNYGSKNLLDKNGNPGQTRILKRWLGIEPAVNRNGSSLSLWITYERAVAIAQALGVSFASVGV